MILGEKSRSRQNSFVKNKMNYEEDIDVDEMNIVQENKVLHRRREDLANKHFRENTG